MAGQTAAGSNLKLKRPDEEPSAMKKDTMAGNVGGSAAHMSQDKHPMPPKRVSLTGGKPRK